MAKAAAIKVRIQIGAGEANPSPPVGTALGPHGVNMMNFCKSFNDKTKHFEKGLVIPVVITIYPDRSFTFVLKTPPAPVLLKKAANISKGSATPHTDKVAKVTRAQLEEIAKIKEPDLTASSLEAAIRSIAGTARSMGIDVVDEASS